MNIVKLIAVFIFAIIFLFLGSVYVEAKFAKYRPLCVGIQGKFSANSTWKGGSIQVGCKGDDGLAVSSLSQKCTGEVQTVRPGNSFRLTKCSCLGSDRGCLKIGKDLKLEPLVNGQRKITVVRRIDQMATFINNSCKINKTGDICGSNGQHITGNVRITCAVPNPSPTITFTPVPTVTPTNSPTPTIGITPGVSLSITPTISPTQPPNFCPVPPQVTNIRVSCPNCFGKALAPTASIVTSCGTSTKPHLKLVGPSAYTISKDDVEITATFTLEAINCDIDEDDLNDFFIESEASSEPTPLRWGFNPEDGGFFAGLDKDENVEFEFTVRNISVVDSGTTEEIEFTVVSYTAENGELFSDPVTVTFTMN